MCRFFKKILFRSKTLYLYCRNRNIFIKLWHVLQSNILVCFVISICISKFFSSAFLVHERLLFPEHLSIFFDVSREIQFLWIWNLSHYMICFGVVLFPLIKYNTDLNIRSNMFGFLPPSPISGEYSEPNYHRVCLYIYLYRL